MVNPFRFIVTPSETVSEASVVQLPCSVVTLPDVINTQLLAAWPSEAKAIAKVSKQPIFFVIFILHAIIGSLFYGPVHNASTKLFASAYQYRVNPQKPRTSVSGVLGTSAAAC